MAADIRKITVKLKIFLWFDECLHSIKGIAICIK